MNYLKNKLILRRPIEINFLANTTIIESQNGDFLKIKLFQLSHNTIDEFPAHTIDPIPNFITHNMIFDNEFTIIIEIASVFCLLKKFILYQSPSVLRSHHFYALYVFLIDF